MLIWKHGPVNIHIWDGRSFRWKWSVRNHTYSRKIWCTVKQFDWYILEEQHRMSPCGDNCDSSDTMLIESESNLWGWLIVAQPHTAYSSTAASTKGPTVADFIFHIFTSISLWVCFSIVLGLFGVSASVFPSKCARLSWMKAPRIGWRFVVNNY